MERPFNSGSRFHAHRRLKRHEQTRSRSSLAYRKFHRSRLCVHSADGIVFPHQCCERCRPEIEFGGAHLDSFLHHNARASQGDNFSAQAWLDIERLCARSDLEGNPCHSCSSRHSCATRSAQTLAKNGSLSFDETRNMIWTRFITRSATRHAAFRETCLAEISHPAASAKRKIPKKTLSHSRQKSVSTLQCTPPSCDCLPNPLASARSASPLGIEHSRDQYDVVPRNTRTTSLHSLVTSPSSSTLIRLLHNGQIASIELETQSKEPEAFQSEIRLRCSRSCTSQCTLRSSRSWFEEGQSSCREQGTR